MVMLILKSSKLFVVSLAFWPLIQILSLVAWHIKARWGLWRLTNWLLRIISIGISLPLEVIISKFFSWFASIWALILGRPCDQRHLALIIGIIIVILWLIIKEWVIIINRLPILHLWVLWLPIWMLIVNLTVAISMVLVIFNIFFPVTVFDKRLV